MSQAGRVASQGQASQEKFQMANLTHWPRITPPPWGNFSVVTLSKIKELARGVRGYYIR